MDKRTEQLKAFCAEWREEIKRLEGELDRAHAVRSPVDAAAVAIALTIRRDAVKRIEAIVGTVQP